MADYLPGPSSSAPSSSPPLPPDRDLYTIPLRAGWFLWDDIHDTERHALAEFFDSPLSITRTPRVYKEYRDFIINKYREDPSRRLNFTEIRKSLVADVGLLRKVFSFLDSWGLINFSATGEKTEEEGGDLPAISVEEGPPGGIKVVACPNSTKGVEPLSRCVGDTGNRAGVTAVGGFRMPPLSSYADVFGDADAVVCVFCGGRCIGGCYQSKKDGLMVCGNCFKDQRFEDTITGEDFELNDITGGNNSDWTDAETLHLLESVIAKRNDWALISDQTKRSKLDCVAKLIQLPFGEHMLSLIGNSHRNKHLVNERTMESNIQHFDSHGMTDTKDSHPYINGSVEEKNENDLSEPSPKRRCIGFSGAGVSLMDQVAALSTVAGPNVASSAAEAVIAALCRENAYAKKVFRVDGSAMDVPDSMISDVCYRREPKVEDGVSWEQSKVSDSSNQVLEKNFVHLTFQMRAGIATALGSAAARAKLLADQEDREIELLMSTILEMQIKKVQSKVKHFQELESIMEKEYIQMQQLKDTMLAEWVHILQIANDAGVLKWRDQGFSRSLPANPG